jgi:Fe2+ or Zn2+ uptake regulation protein
MNIEKVITALDSSLRREILRILSHGPMTVNQVLEHLKKGATVVRYRETVYRALEKLVDSELVLKYYNREKGLCYRLLSNKLTIKIAVDSIQVESKNN